MSKQKIIIIEGGQGLGKTTITNLLREKLRYTNLIRLSGTDDKTFIGEFKATKMYHGLLDYLEAASLCNINFVFDRIFISEKVFADLGYKEYFFHRQYNELLKRLAYLDAYDISVILLKAEPDVIKERLCRDKQAFLDIPFDYTASKQQEECYAKLLKNISNDYPWIKTLTLDTSSISPEDVVDRILNSLED